MYGHILCVPYVGAMWIMPQKAKELGVPVNQWGLLQKGRSVQVGESIILPEQVIGEARKGLKFVFSGDTAACDALTGEAVFYSHFINL